MNSRRQASNIRRISFLNSKAGGAQCRIQLSPPHDGQSGYVGLG